MSGAPKRKSALLLLVAAFFALPLHGQEAVFAVVADTHIGSGSAAADLEAVVRAINGRPDIDFVVVDGDVTEKGRSSEFAEARRILGGLRPPGRVLPGNHDAHWVGRALTHFRGAWPDDKFLFQKGAATFLGLDSGELGHLAPEDLAWLEARLAAIPGDASLFVFLHHPPANVDNWFKAHNLLKDRRAYVFGGHVHKTQVSMTGGIPAVTVRSALARDKPDAWGYLLVKVWADAVEFLEVTGPGAPVPVGAVRRADWTPAPEMPAASFRGLGARILWKADLGTSVAGPAVSDGTRVFAATAKGDITCLDLKGNVQWTSGAGGALVAPPEIAAGKLWVATASGRVSALDAESGRLVRTRAGGEPATSPVVFVGKGPRGRPALLAATLREDAGILSCLDAETLEPLWIQKDAGGMIQTRPLVADGKVVYGSWDGCVHGLNLEDGREIWRWSSNPNFYYSPAGCVPQTDGRRVFVCAPDGFVTALELADGKQAWREKRGAWESLGLSKDGKRLVVKGLAGDFSVVEAATGALLHRTSPAHGPSDILPVVPIEKDGHVLYGAQNGYVYEIDPAGNISPVLFMGAAGVHSIQPLKGDVFAATNADGLIVVFRWR
jgi:outer membrane protein assembly factor BamB/predicted phosphodiesterase